MLKNDDQRNEMNLKERRVAQVVGQLSVMKLSGGFWTSSLSGAEAYGLIQFHCSTAGVRKILMLYAYLNAMYEGAVSHPNKNSVHSTSSSCRPRIRLQFGIPPPLT